MNKWLDEEYEFEVEVLVGYLRGDKTEGICSNGEEIGDKYSCTYGCPVNQEGYGICSKTMMMLYPSESGGIWNLLEDYDDALSVDGSHQKWRRSEKCGWF